MVKQGLSYEFFVHSAKGSSCEGIQNKYNLVYIPYSLCCAWDCVCAQYVEYVCHLMWPSRYTDLWIHTPQNGPEAGVGLDRTTEIHPAGVGEISNHKQLAHHLTVWVFCFLSLCWEISGALWCWALSIVTLERSVSWLTAGTPLCSGIHWSSAPTILCCPTRLALCAAKEYPAACVG